MIRLCESALAAAGAAGAAVLLGAASPARASAQTGCTASGIPSSCTTAMTLQLTQRATIRATVSPTSFSFSVTPSDYNQGYTQSLGHSVTVQSNTTWTLSIRSSQTSWTGTGGARVNKPRTELQWATSAGGPYTATPGNTAATALTVTTGTASAGTVVSIYYRILWSWTLDTPGTYTVPVILLLAAP